MKHEKIAILNYVHCCDHGVKILDHCEHCESLAFWYGIRNALALALPFWIIAGLVLIWSVR